MIESVGLGGQLAEEEKSVWTPESVAGVMEFLWPGKTEGSRFGGEGGEPNKERAQLEVPGSGDSEERGFQNEEPSPQEKDLGVKPSFRGAFFADTTGATGWHLVE